MSFVKTKGSKPRLGKGLPGVARRLIEANRKRRLNLDKTGAGFRGNLDKTLLYLKWKAENHTLLGAMSYIADEMERERLYALYRQLFPEEWRASKASFTRKGCNDYHTEREFEFITLVSEKYFSLEMWLDWSDYRFDHIPIEPVNFDFCCGDFEWQEMRPCLRFGIAAFLYRGGGLYDTDWNEILSSFNLEREDLPPINHENPPYSELNRQRENSRVLRFLHLIEFIHHESGNPFIDATCCQPADLFEWTKRNLEYLKNQYGKVNIYFESMDSLDADIKLDPSKTFKELISLWNTGNLPTKGRKKQAADKEERDKSLLINIFADEMEFAEPALVF